MPGETNDRKTFLELYFENSESFPYGGKFIKSDGKQPKSGGK
jgi:hypothetical protein